MALATLGRSEVSSVGPLGSGAIEAQGGEQSQHHCLAPQAHRLSVALARSRCCCYSRSAPARSSPSPSTCPLTPQVLRGDPQGPAGDGRVRDHRPVWGRRRPAHPSQGAARGGSGAGRPQAPARWPRIGESGGRRSGPAWPRGREGRAVETALLRSLAVVGRTGNRAPKPRLFRGPARAAGGYGDR